MSKNNVVFTHQKDQMDCGPASLCMVASYYGKKYDLQYLRENSFITRDGVSVLGISEAANKIGFETLTVLLNTERLKEMSTLCILHWNQNHFVVLIKIYNFNRFIPFSKPIWRFKIADPAYGFITYNEAKFKKSWFSTEDKGIGLFLEPTAIFYETHEPAKSSLKIKFILDYLKPYSKQSYLLFFMLFLGSSITFLFPFLTQYLIDNGINVKNVNNIKLVLLAQLGLYFGFISTEIFRNWLMLNVGTKISITIISDFINKLMQLSIFFFDTKMMGDINQRIQDNENIEHFLTSESLLTFFSIISFTVFFGVLWFYDLTILLVYLVLTCSAICWSLFWVNKMRNLNYFHFQQRSENQESIYEIINGITEIKLNQLEDFKLKKWNEIQQKLYKINIRILKINQFQLAGFDFLNQIKNILVTFLAAISVINGKMSLGELLGVSYIIGQMNSPVNQLVSFFKSLQEAKLSLERLNEVQNQDTEEGEIEYKISSGICKMSNVSNEGIQIKNVSFQYEGPKSTFVLKDIDFFIPEGKITAIVGASGSGKTTLMKLFLKFYKPTQGDIFYDSNSIALLSPEKLRKNCGVVMQDGFIFSDTIERNIACGDEIIDAQKLKNALKIANIESFIEELPLGGKTKIGASGNSISGGQKQRILIARVVYKNPKYIFFDEATSALDTVNEKKIHDNLQAFFKGKTVVVIAHRLSTVKSANQIVVLKNGKIVETGSHQELVSNKSDYFNLVKNQLELGG